MVNERLFSVVLIFNAKKFVEFIWQLFNEAHLNVAQVQRVAHQYDVTIGPIRDLLLLLS